MKITGRWAEPCPDCKALDSCCETSMTRLEIANSLARLVDRQGRELARLRHELYDAKQVIADLRRTP